MGGKGFFFFSLYDPLRFSLDLAHSLNVCEFLCDAESGLPLLCEFP